MYKSKLIQFMQIDDGTGKKYQIDNEEYETLVKNITEQIFGGKQINLNKDILLGLIYDSGLRSSKRIEMLDYHFIRQHSISDTVRRYFHIQRSCNLISWSGLSETWNLSSRRY